MPAYTTAKSAEVDGRRTYEHRRSDPVELWVEVVGPIVDALNVLAREIHQTPDTLAGASIAVTERGTLLLNQRAWILFAAPLKTLPTLVTKHSSRDESKPIRFLLIANDVAPA